jgi:large subunit ribosomal protein L13
MKTYYPKKGDIQEQWYVVDAENEVLGRLASRIALVLRGKNSPRFTPHADMGAHVIVVNAEKIRLTGRKMDDKTYHRHTGWIGGLRSTTARKLLEKKPTEVLRKAVRGMLPHNRLGNATMKRLRLFAGPTHDHAAQKPIPLVLTKAVKEKDQ